MSVNSLALDEYAELEKEMTMFRIEAPTPILFLISQLNFKKAKHKK